MVLDKVCMFIFLLRHHRELTEASQHQVLCAGRQTINGCKVSATLSR
ncbi:hypothetical protein PRUB_b0178 [Pseudoalteromonas rubra]|uniref:Uncharacterized protein n=1 Tax=Pseudoalteromonas rubra TaxID=43658 RepID=A0A8T0BY91_9GAMM|nr:hypothetical protein PRUB_b0178 [Pseudoalteromonas rubra]